MARVRFPDGAFFCILNVNNTIAWLAQLAARRSHNPKVVSSKLTPSKIKKSNSLGLLAQLVAHGSYVPRVTGSIPVQTNFPCFFLVCYIIYSALV